jgi:hypothetical protein
MTFGPRHFVTNHSRFIAVRRALCRTALLGVTAFIGASFLTALFAYPPLERSVTVPAPSPSNSDTYWAALDTRFESYFSPNTFSESGSLRSDDDRPIPTSPQPALSKESNIATTPPQRVRALPRPASEPHPSNRISRHAALSLHPQSNEDAPNEPSTTFDNFFTKLFRKTYAAVTLAYAAPDLGPLNDGGKITDRFDQWTAVYDISAHAVYMPDGTKLEAHSGLGSSFDDPRHVDEKNSGPTPPNVYNLELREQPFHGVSALRLIPVDEKKALGRTGLLAHSFLLGPDGQSNGCVSFRDYGAFLRAYSNHQIKRLVVVARLD